MNSQQRTKSRFSSILRSVLIRGCYLLMLLGSLVLKSQIFVSNGTHIEVGESSYFYSSTPIIYEKIVSTPIEYKLNSYLGENSKIAAKHTKAKPSDKSVRFNLPPKAVYISLLPSDINYTGKGTAKFFGIVHEAPHNVKGRVLSYCHYRFLKYSYKEKLLQQVFEYIYVQALENFSSYPRPPSLV